MPTAPYSVRKEFLSLPGDDSRQVHERLRRTWWQPASALMMLIVFGPAVLVYALLVPLMGVAGELAFAARVTLLISALVLPAFLYYSLRRELTRQIRNDAFRLFVRESLSRRGAL